MTLNLPTSEVMPTHGNVPSVLWAMAEATSVVPAVHSRNVDFVSPTCAFHTTTLKSRQGGHIGAHGYRQWQGIYSAIARRPTRRALPSNQRSHWDSVSCKGTPT